jgi:DNA polymerase-3 subunit alpha
MGKKIQAEMDAQRSRFVEGCQETSGIDVGEANKLFDLIDKFAGYGFNKSHAAAYALLAYQTGWLKAHYPEEFYAAAMCFDLHQSEKLAVFVDDARRYPGMERGVEVLPPDINASHARFTVEQTDHGHAVRFALAGIRNVGEKAMEAIVTERERGGPFTSLKDFCERIPHGSMNRRQFEALAGAGALDSLERNRALVAANAEHLLAIAEAAMRERSSGQAALFGGEDAPVVDELRLTPTEPWSRVEAMGKERENFGFYFSGHPVEQFRDVAMANGARSYEALMEAGAPSGGRGSAVMAVMIEGMSKARTKRGDDFVRGDFSDPSGQFSAACFETALIPQFENWAASGECLLLDVELDSRDPAEPPRLTVRGARPLSAVSGSTPMRLIVDVFSQEAITELKAELELARDKTRAWPGEVVIKVALAEGGEQPICLGQGFVLGGELAERLAAIPGIANVELAPMRRRPNLRLVA